MPLGTSERAHSQQSPGMVVGGVRGTWEQEVNKEMNKIFVVTKS